MPEENKVAGALSEIRQFCTTHSTVGNGQCYALAGYYAWRTCGGDISYSNGHNTLPLKGGGVNACDAWRDWDWASGGAQTKGAPISPGDLKEGAIICIAGNGAAPFYAQPPYGHIAVVGAINGGDVEILQQNYGATAGRCSIEHFNAASFCSSLTGIIYPSGSGGNGATGEWSGSAGGDYSNPAAQLIHVQEIVNFETKTIEFPNPLKEIKDYVAKVMGGQKAWHWRFLHSDFCEIELMDFYGNSFSYQPELFSTTRMLMKNWKVTYVGSLGDYNNCRIFINGYKNFLDYDFGVKNVIKNPELLNYSLQDMISKDLTIINDTTASYLQSNKNQMLAQQASFNENAKMIKRQNALRNKQVDFQNDQSAYSANYAVKMANLQDDRLGAHQTTGLIGDGLGILGNLLGGNFSGAIMSGINMGTGIYNNQFDSKISQAGIANAEKMRGFTRRGNKLNKQAANLANMQAKLSLKQAKRAFNAQLKDIENQPDAIQQQGADLAFPTGNNLTGVYVMVKIPLDAMIDIIIKELQTNGAVLGLQTPMILDILKDKYEEISHTRRHIYLKCGELENNLPLPASLSAAMNAIFQTGVRIWFWRSKDSDQVFIDNGGLHKEPFYVYYDNYDDQAIVKKYKDFASDLVKRELIKEEQKEEWQKFINDFITSSNK